MPHQFAPHQFAVGQRVELHPRLDDWMRGDRFGAVVKIGRSRVHVKLDRSGRVRLYSPADITPV